MDQQKIGNFIMKLRKKNKLTQSKLASLIFVARETVGKWERGINTPDSHSLVLLSELFNVSVNELIVGEYINDDNKEKISTLALNMLTDNRKKKNNHQFIVISIIGVIILFIIFYFTYNFNSMRVYLISGENEEYALSQSLIVISKQKSYIQIGSIISKADNDNIAGEKNYKISLYYNSSNQENLLFSSFGSDTLYINFNNNETLSYKELISMIGNLYLIIEEGNKKSKIELNARLDYVDNYLFPINIREEEPITKYSDEITINQQRTSKTWHVIGPVEYETASKKLSLSANCSESENTCRVVFVTTWKVTPKIRSYDLVGIRLSNTIFLDDKYTSIANDDIEPVYNYCSYRGVGSIFNLNGEDIKTITQTFNVEYRGSIYATYQHANAKLSLKDAKKFNYNSIGYGQVFVWDAKKTEEFYEDMPGIRLILK